MPGSSAGAMKHGRAQAAERKEFARNDVNIEHRAYMKAMGIKAKARMSLAESVAHHIHENRGEYESFRASHADAQAAKMWKTHMRAEHARGPSVAKTRGRRGNTDFNFGFNAI